MSARLSKALATASESQDQLADEIHRYQLEKVGSHDLVGGELCVKKWWTNRATLYPRLSKLADKMMGACATSVLSEQCFSHTGQIATTRRPNLRPQTL